VSIILLLVISPLLRVKYYPKDELYALGLLQVVWIMARRRDLQESVGDVSPPTIDQLRCAGLVQICPLTDSIDREPGLTSVHSGKDSFWTFHFDINFFLSLDAHQTVPSPPLD
jgi:hypothetical protein